MRYPTSVAILVIAAWLAVMGGLFGCGGCAGHGQYTPATQTYNETAAADVAVVSAQTVRETALGVFSAFMYAEKAHEAAFLAISPTIHETAELVRRDGQKYLNALSASITAYQNARTPENAGKLKSALAAVNSLLASATQQFAEATTKAP